MTKSTALTRKDSFTTVRDMLNNLADAIGSALPKHLTAERQIRIATTGLQKNPELLDCTAHSIVSCIIQASQLGLEPDGITGQAYLVPFRNSKTGQKECQLIPGYKGYLALAYNSGHVDSVNAKAVYEGDKFQFNFGLHPDLLHVPKYVKGTRAITHVYCVVQMKTGGFVFEVMSKEEVDDHKDRYSHASKRKDSPWNKEWESMALKTVIRRALKLVPQSPDLRMAITLDETAETGMGQKFADMDMGEILDVTTEQQTQQLKDKLEQSKEKTIKQPTKAKDKADSTIKTEETLKEPILTPTQQFKGDYEALAIDLFNKYSALGGDSPTLLDTLTGNKRIDIKIDDKLKHRVISVFNKEIDALTEELAPKQEELIND